MMKFKRFAAGSYTDEEITDFINTHRIVRDQYFAGGDIYIYYFDLKDFGTTTIELVERVNKAIVEAEKQVFDAQADVDEANTALADVAEKISQTDENDKEAWDALQKERVEWENVITMANGTIAERTKQITALGLKYQDLVNQI